MEKPTTHKEVIEWRERAIRLAYQAPVGTPANQRAEMILLSLRNAYAPSELQ